MANTVDTGVFTTSLLPQSMRTYYDAILLDTLRSRTVYNQFCFNYERFDQADAKTVTLTEVFDLLPSIGALSEGVPFVEGAYLDSRQLSITVEERGNIVKTNKFHNRASFWNSGDFEGVVRNKVGWNLADSVDVTARNAFLTCTTNLWYPNSKTARATLTSSDTFSVDDADLAMTNLESRDAFGMDPSGNAVAIVHPRVARDIRKDSQWVNASHYAGATQLFTGEIGMWDNVRFVKSNRAKLPNAGVTTAQTTLTSGATKGATTLTVADTTGFVVGKTISLSDNALGTAVLETDAELEHVVVDTVASSTSLTLKKPILRDHASGQYVTYGLDIYPVVVVGGPQAVVYGVTQNPQLVVPPMIDDFQRINRLGWYGIFKQQKFREEFVEVILCAASS